MSSSVPGPLARIRTVYTNRYEPEYMHSFADLYWRTLLSLACIVVAVACVYGAMQFFDALSQLSSSAPVSSPGPQSSAGLDKKQLDATLNGFAARADVFKNLQSGSVPKITDPSK